MRLGVNAKLKLPHWHIEECLFRWFVEVAFRYIGIYVRVSPRFADPHALQVGFPFVVISSWEFALVNELASRTHAIVGNMT